MFENGFNSSFPQDILDLVYICETFKKEKNVWVEWKRTGPQKYSFIQCHLYFRSDLDEIGTKTNGVQQDFSIMPVLLMFQYISGTAGSPEAKENTDHCRPA